MADKKEKNENVTIHIDKKVYKTENSTLTGSQLRSLPKPPIAAGYDLLLEVPGGDDQTVADDTTIQLNNGMHFFSAPRNITPGR